MKSPPISDANNSYWTRINGRQVKKFFDITGNIGQRPYPDHVPFLSYKI